VNMRFSKEIRNRSRVVMESFRAESGFVLGVLGYDMIANPRVAKEVQAAIESGAETLSAICQRTNYTPDQVGYALAYLLLTAKTTRTETRGNDRLYFPVIPPRPRGPLDDPPLSFSILRGLMPRARSLKC
jgi:hypothetical protein